MNRICKILTDENNNDNNLDLYGLASEIVSLRYKHGWSDEEKKFIDDYSFLLHSVINIYRNSEAWGQLPDFADLLYENRNHPFFKKYCSSCFEECGEEDYDCWRNSIEDHEMNTFDTMEAIFVYICDEEDLKLLPMEERIELMEKYLSDWI